MTALPRRKAATRWASLGDTAIIRSSLGTVADYPDHPGEWGDLDAIARLWSADAIREAVLIASPVLASQVGKLLSSPGGADPPLKKRKRLHKGLLKYALRLSTRCTPFGMFAGVAVLPVGDGVPVLGKSHIRHVRTTGAVTRRLVEEARGLPQARLYPNPSLTERAGRLVVTVMRGVDDIHTVASISATGPARLAVATAAGTATRQDIERRVAEAYPAAGSAKVHKLVDDLLHAEVLLCEAEHSAFDGDPLVRMPDAVEGVTEMRAAVTRYSEASDPVDDGSLDALLRQCSAGDNTQRDLHVDVELDASGQMPAAVVDAAVAAVTALAATMAHRPVAPALEQFSAAFVERYGQTLVPFLTAVDEELGIGYPRAYESSLPAATTPDPAVGRRRDLIARLLQRAASADLDVVELTDADLADFPEPDGMPSSFDLILKLHREPAGLRASVSGLGFPGGSTVGRFTALMSQARDFAQRCVEFDTAWWTGNTSGRGILCGIDYISGADSINEVAATAQLYPVTLAVNARPHCPTGTVLTLADIYLGHADGRMRTVLADGTPVSVRQLSMATTRASAKAIRLLREISDAGTRQPFWSWGEAETLMNDLPAVRYRGVILAEQRWRYPAFAARTQAALRDWIVAAGVSRHVRVGPYDNRLHLDTQHPRHLDLLLDEIIAGNPWLFRAPSPDQLGVVDDYGAAAHAAEAVVTVAAPAASRAEPDLTGRPLHDPADDEHRLLVPGGPWTAFAITVGSNSHDRTLRAFADAFPDLVDDWYFVRYREHGRDQLRLRVRRPVAELTGVLTWLADARRAGRIGDYTIPVYHRELQRYGGSRSFPCYERLFCRETAHIVGMLPIIDSDAPTPATSAPPVRPGVEAAAGVLTQWLDGLDESLVNTGQVIDVAVERYSRELGEAVHKIKTALRRQRPHIDADNGLAGALREFWDEPDQHDAVLTPTVLQSASHLLCNRLGLLRHEEFAAMWLVKTERNRMQRRKVRPRHGPTAAPSAIVESAVTLGWDIMHRCRTHIHVAERTTIGRAMWSAMSAAHGDLGVAMSYTAADQLDPDGGWGRLAHMHLANAAQSFQQGPPPDHLGLFSGAAALAFALRAHSESGRRYQSATNAIDTLLAERLEAATANLRPEDGSETAFYDVISGVTGAVTYTFTTDAWVGELSESALRAIDTLAELALTHRPGGLFTPPGKLSDLERERYGAKCAGFLNCGFAHGIAGVLNVFGQACDRGWGSPLVAEATEHLTDVLLKASDRDGTLDVPYILPPETAPATARSRYAWCYGNLGAALPFHNSTTLRHKHPDMVARLLDTSSRTDEDLQLDGPTLCHGQAGKLVLERIMLGEHTVADNAVSLLQLVDPQRTFLFEDDAGTDSPGFLIGSGGAGAALLSLQIPSDAMPFTRMLTGAWIV